MEGAVHSSLVLQIAMPAVVQQGLEKEQHNYYVMAAGNRQQQYKRIHARHAPMHVTSPILPYCPSPSGTRR